MAIRGISLGEEITISYIDSTEMCGHEDELEAESEENLESSVEERKRQLREFYLFDCRCQKCSQEELLR